MKKLILILILATTIFSLSAQDTIRNFIFGHSLLDHRPPAIPTPSDETTVPHWLFLLAEESNKYYAATGQYGFLQQHDNLPPFAQWGYDLVPTVWESDYEDFSEADFTNILITAGNFMQWQPPTEVYFGDPDGVTPISATITINDWLLTQEDSLHILIYENWPDMAGYMESFPPTQEEFQNYNNYTTGEFHDWWLEYHDALRIHNPNIKMVPVGPVLAELLQESPYSDIPMTELYEDDAPHGRASLYFLASMVTYMSLYQEKPASTFQVPSIIHNVIVDNYPEIIDFMWDYLSDFNDEDNVSRVFCADIINGQHEVNQENISIYPNPTTGLLHLDTSIEKCTMQVFDSRAILHRTISVGNNALIDLSDLAPGLYFVKIRDQKNAQVYLQKIIKD